MDGRFSHILFAIFDDHNANKGHNPEGNVLPFSKVFNCEAIQLDKLLEEAQVSPKEETDVQMDV